MTWGKTFKYSSLTFALVSSLVLTGCSPSSGPTPTASKSQAPAFTLNWVSAPLTGRQYIKETNPQLDGPVVMGKIDNSFAARPQGGLSKADIVYEELVEGGITRYLAIFHSQLPERFGPLRSVRPMDPDIAAPYGGIIAYSGGQKPFVTAMRKTGLYNASETSESTIRTMKRVKDREAPHNLFVLAQRLQARHKHLKAPTSSLQFAESAFQSSAYLLGKPVQTLVASYPETKARWDYDQNYGVFLRSQDGKKSIDVDNHKVQISATNVFVIRVKVDRSFRDPRYGFVPKTLFEGKGKGQLMTGGKVIDILWSKKNQKSQAVFTTKDGKPILVGTGNTWFEMVPTDVGSVKITYRKVATSPSSTPSPTPSK